MQIKLNNSQLQREVWKPVPLKPYSKIYLISNYGRIKSKNRILKEYRKYGKQYKHILTHRKGKMLSLNTDKNGYYHVILRCRTSHKDVRVHRLVARAFISNPYHYPIVNHKDEDKQNNYYKNLEWCIVSYNDNYGTRVKRITKQNKFHEGVKPIKVGNKHIHFIFPSVIQASIYLHKYFLSNHSIVSIKSSLSKVARHAPHNKSAYGFFAEYL